MPGAKPDEQDIRDFKEDLEIVSAEGTLGNGDCHIHVSVSKKDSTVVGGHLKEGVVRITAEVTLVELDDREFNRKLDPETGFKELSIK
jgi:predicted DNA-binding protein with PD1-like motif